MVMFLFTLAEGDRGQSLHRAHNAIRGLLELALKLRPCVRTMEAGSPCRSQACREGHGARAPWERIALDGVVTRDLRQSIRHRSRASLPSGQGEGGDNVFRGHDQRRGIVRNIVTAEAGHSAAPDHQCGRIPGPKGSRARRPAVRGSVRRIYAGGGVRHRAAGDHRAARCSTVHGWTGSTRRWCCW